MKNSKFIDQFATFAGKLGNQIHLKNPKRCIRNSNAIIYFGRFNRSFEQHGI